MITVHRFQLELLKCARYSDFVVLGVLLMRLMMGIWLILLLQPLAYGQDANSLSCISCSSRFSNCPDDSLQRGAYTEDLMMHRNIDNLSLSQHRQDLTFSKINRPLTKGAETENLSNQRRENALYRGAFTADLRSNRQKDDLSRGAYTANLTFGQPGNYLNRGVQSQDLMMTRKSDDLSRGRETEFLSRCD